MVLSKVDADFEVGGSYAILGDRGVGKTTLARVIVGSATRYFGQVIRGGMVSVPVGPGSVLGGETSAKKLVNVLSRLHQAKPEEVRDNMSRLSNRQWDLRIPLKRLGPEDRQLFNMTLGYSLPADFYVFDGLIAPSDPGAQELCLQAFGQRRRTAGTILFTRKASLAKAYADVIWVISQGSLIRFADRIDALEFYRESQALEESGPVSDAKRMVQQGSRRDAIVYLLNTEAAGADPDAREYLGELAIAENDPTLLRQVLEQLDQFPDGPSKASFLRARLAQIENDKQGLLRHLRDHLRQHPNDREGVVALAKALDHAGEHREAGEFWLALSAKGSIEVFSRLAIKAFLSGRAWDRIIHTLSLMEHHRPLGVRDIEAKIGALMELDQVEDVREVFVVLMTQSLERAMAFVFWTTKRPKAITTAQLLLLARDRLLDERAESTHLTMIVRHLRSVAATCRKQDKVPAAEYIESVVAPWSSHASGQPNENANA